MLSLNIIQPKKETFIKRMGEEIEFPQYFLCPISLQIMRDPVTTVTGITYDRASIEQWLATAAVCPVTKQPLPPTSDLTPNHMLRRLIQAWCTANAVDRIPTPKCPLQRSIVLKLIRELNRRPDADRSMQMNALTIIDKLAAENDGVNRRIMAEAGVPNAMLSFIVKSFKIGEILGVEEALRVLKLTLTPEAEIGFVGENSDVIESIMWILKIEIEDSAKLNALLALKNLIEIETSTLIEKLNLEFFEEIVKMMKEKKFAQSAIQVLIETCSWGRNRAMIVAAGAVAELIEMELRSNQENKRATEAVFGLLAQLCYCAEGRQELLKHAAGMAVVAKRLLRNSAATDDRALCVMESVARFAATKEVVAEMLRVGAVAKLCMVMQADCADYLKRKAREILRLHSSDWSNSPCIQVYLLTRNPR